MYRRYAGSAITIRDRERDGVIPIIRRHKAEVRRVAVGNDLAIAGDDVPLQDVRVGRAGIGETAAQIDGVAFKDIERARPGDSHGSNVENVQDNRG